MTVLDRVAVVADPGSVSGQQDPDPEVPERARRRSFTAQYKLDVLAAYDAAAAPDSAAGERDARCASRSPCCIVLRVAWVLS